MESTAAFVISVAVAIFLPLFMAILLSLGLWGKSGRAEEDKARARRLADAKMNARLLRLNL